MLGDAELVQQWVRSSVERPDFWTATPRWSDQAARLLVDGELVVWVSDTGPLVVGVLATVVAVHLDGSVTLQDLAEDLAAAADLASDGARGLVASMAVELAAAGAWVGVALGAVPERAAVPEHAEVAVGGRRETEVVDPVSGEVIRVVVERDGAGQEVTTEHLPDGTRRITTMLTFDLGDGERGLATAELLAGDRSAAELVPLDSCLGSKLRNSDDVDLVAIVCPDGQVRCVRCHDPVVGELLRERAGPALAPAGSRGPIEAFVVTPLEGCGPLRIYDGHGQRRGRPRTAGEVVDVVDQILGERTSAAGRGPGVGVPLVLVTGPGEPALVPVSTVDAPRAMAALRRGGWTAGAGWAEIGADGAVASPGVFGARGGVAPVRLVDDGSAERSTAALVQALIRRPEPDRTARQRVLERIAGLVGAARRVPVGSEWPRSAEALGA